MEVSDNVSLKSLNTFGIDVNCRFLIRASNESHIREAILFAQEKKLPLFILGGGSNFLLTRSPEAVVLKVELKGIKAEAEKNNKVLLEAAAGEKWHDLVLFCVQRNWGGIENLSLIPGLVGATPIQNIGAYGVELKDVLIQVKIMDLQSGVIRVLENEACKFGYRDSIFKHELAGKIIVLSITLELNPDPVLHTSYGAIKTELQKTGKSEFTIKDISDTVIRIRQSKLPDPAVIGNAGSFFKNPEVTLVKYESLLEAEPTMPSYPASSEKRKIPAGWLIEQAGWKGKRFGNFGVHPEQALVLVNYGGATGTEILELSEKIQKSVFEKFGIDLEREVNVI